MPIAHSFDEAQAQVNDLVERFRRNLDAYRRPEYKEAQVRVEFINPFLEALGWDVRNVQGYAETYKDVVHEDASEVDAQFLQEIEGWRDVLARSIALRYPALSVPELNFAVQITIDRILFLRMAEDRGIEPYGRLLALCGGPRIYPRLVDDLYRSADEEYNSGLFVSSDPAISEAIMHGVLFPYHVALIRKYGGE